MNPQQGQMGQPGSQQGPSQQRSQTMYRPEHVRQMTFLSPDDRAKYETLMKGWYQQMEANGPDAADARRRIVEFSRVMISKANQARMIMQQRQNLAAQQQGQAAQTQQAHAQTQAQLKAQASAAATAAIQAVKSQERTPAQAQTQPQNQQQSSQGQVPGQGQKLPENVQKAVNQIPFIPPPDIVQQGNWAIKKWKTNHIQKFVGALMQMEGFKTKIAKYDSWLKKDDLSSQDILMATQNREQLTQKLRETHQLIENFKRSQMEALASQKTSENSTAARNTPAQTQQTQQQQPQSQQPQQQQTGQAQQSQQQGLNQNVTATISAAIETAKNQQLPAGPIGRLPQQQTQTASSPGQPGQVPAPTTSTLTPTGANSAPASTTPQPVVKTEPGTGPAANPAPANTSITANNPISANGTPINTHAPPTPRSVAVHTPANAVPRPLPQNTAVSTANANTTTTRTSQSGSVTVTGQSGSAGGTPASAGSAGVIGAMPQAPIHGHHSGQQSSTTISSKFAISKQLPDKATAPPTPVTMPAAPRPTITQGSGVAGGVMGQPAVAKPPGYTFEGDAKHVLSKTKLDELCRQVSGGAPEGQDGNYLTPEVEEASYWTSSLYSLTPSIKY